MIGEGIGERIGKGIGERIGERIEKELEEMASWLISEPSIALHMLPGTVALRETIRLGVDRCILPAK